MNDDFIYAALPKVPKDFAQSLYTKISAERRPQSRPHPKVRNPRRIQVAIIILGLLLLVAWSQVTAWNRYRYVPIGNIWLVEMSHPTKEVASQQPTLGLIPTPRPEPTIIVEGTVYYLSGPVMNLSPDWIPNGFSAQEIPSSWISYEETLGLWVNEAQEKIRLFAVPMVGGMHPYAPAGMYEEEQVNGQPAVLIRGRLALTDPKNPTARRIWDETLGLQLTWTIEEGVYTLETFGLYLPEQDLIRMAESMKVVPWPQGP